MDINKNAPVIQRNKIIINASRSAVWKVLTDINNWAKWNTSISKSEIKSSISIGNSFCWKINGFNINSTIQLNDKNNAFGWTGKSLGVKAIHNWYLEEENNTVIVRVEESMEGWLVSLLKKKMNTTMKEDMNSWLKELKKECESINLLTR